MILLTIFLTPVAVGLKQGVGAPFLINLVPTLIGWLPGRDPRLPGQHAGRRDARLATEPLT